MASFLAFFLNVILRLSKMDSILFESLNAYSPNLKNKIISKAKRNF